MIRQLYSVLLWLAQPLLRFKLARRGRRESGYLEAIEERFGRYTQPPALSTGKTVWLHAVSLGETRAAALLLARLREQLPGMTLLLTHGTATGRAQGQSLLLPGDAQVWQPWDTPQAVSAFLQHFRPSIGILLETEVWPNLTAGCVRAGVPLVLVNARLSEKSLRQAQRFSALAGPAYRSLSAVWPQTEEDAARLRQLGAPVQAVFGNLKFDIAPNVDQLLHGRAWRSGLDKPVVMLASSREGEELSLLQALRVLGEAMHAVQWLIVPRHPQRFEQVAGLIESQGFSVSRRSSWLVQPLPADIWLGDSLGEMALYYGMSSAALLGGSFAPLGGQNLIEAAACACPVVMGPHTFNFQQVALLAERSGAALRADGLSQAVQVSLALVRDRNRQQAMAQAAEAFASAHRGASARTAQAIRTLLTWPAAR